MLRNELKPGYEAVKWAKRAECELGVNTLFYVLGVTGSVNNSSLGRWADGETSKRALQAANWY